METTDWGVLNGSENVSENADVIVNYIKFREEENYFEKKTRSTKRTQKPPRL